MKLGIDLHRLAEDERILLMAEAAKTKLIAVVLERGEPEKIKRYIRKMTANNAVRHIDTIDGPTSGAVFVRFGPKLHAQA